ncbi:hypothetical protein ANRL2_00225 [Anaerolineae bacterium]|nr:hypothetical protein ANRL2_00225 [Anaerolineae bacterium]
MPPSTVCRAKYSSVKGQVHSCAGVSTSALWHSFPPQTGVRVASHHPSKQARDHVTASQHLGIPVTKLLSLVRSSGVLA